MRDTPIWLWILGGKEAAPAEEGAAGDGLEEAEEAEEEDLVEQLKKKLLKDLIGN